MSSVITIWHAIQYCHLLTKFWHLFYTLIMVSLSTGLSGRGGGGRGGGGLLHKVGWGGIMSKKGGLIYGFSCRYNRWVGRQSSHLPRWVLMWEWRPICDAQERPQMLHENESTEAGRCFLLSFFARIAAALLTSKSFVRCVHWYVQRALSKAVASQAKRGASYSDFFCLITGRSTWWTKWMSI